MRTIDRLARCRSVRDAAVAPRRGRAKWLVGSVAVIAMCFAACAEQQPTAVPLVELPQPANVVGLYRCTGDVHQLAVKCDETQPTASGGARMVSMIVGAQNRYMRLASNAVAYNSTTQIFSFTVTVQNLMQQSMATTGVNPDPGGVKVFFNTGPTVTSGTGSATVANATGVGTFTGPNQPYFQYGGNTGSELGTDGILTTGEISSSKAWQLLVSPTVATFSFTLYVQSEMPSTTGPFLSFAQLAAGSSHSCGLTKTTGLAYCWGADDAGELGDGGFSDKFLPVPVSGSLTFKAIVAGGGHTCGLAPSGQAYCWGENSSGELGDGTTTASSTPVAVTQAGVTFTKIAAGLDGTCGLTALGQAYCWGDNSSGQLGIGVMDQGRSTPTAVSQPAGVAFDTIVIGDLHTCAVSTTGAGYCWGLNDFGELGDGTQSQRSSPVSVGQANGVTIAFRTIGAGSLHSCGVSTAGTLYCWGDNTAGQLGNGGQEDLSTTPVAVSAPAGVSFNRLTATFGQTCAITTTNKPYCWGDNSAGELGAGTNAPVASSPVPVARVDPAIALGMTTIAGGFRHMCGITTSITTGTPAACWGEGSNGELGNGMFMPGPQNYPVYVGGTR